MQKSKLIQILKTFSKQEMKNFEKFISSPYFSPGRNLKPLFKVLKKFHPSFASESFTSEKVFRKLYPGMKYEKKKSGHVLQVMVSELISLTEKFLALEQMQRDCDGYYVYKFLSHAFFDKKLFGFSKKVMLKNLERIQQSQLDYQFYEEMISLNDDIGNLLVIIDKQKEMQGHNQRIPLYLYGYLTSWLLQLVNNSASSDQLSYNKNTINMKLLEMGVNAFEPKIFENECYDDGLGTKQLILTTYFVLKSLLNSKDKENLRTANDIYKRNFQYFKRSVKWGLLATILNICSIRSSEDPKFYPTLGSELIDFVIDNGFISQYEGFFLPPPAYLSFFHLKLYVLRYEELKIFVDTTLEKIDPEHRKSLYEYSYAWLSFKKNNYERTLEILSGFSYHEQTIKYIAAQLRIASLYSLGYIQEALYSLDSNDRLIRSIGIKSGLLSKTVPKFMKSARILIKYKKGSDAADENILNKLVENNSNYFQFWFKAETEKLKSKA